LIPHSHPTSKVIDHLRRGVKLKEGYTLPAEVEVIGHENNKIWLSVAIKEGRNRQVRRMLERVGYPVERLICVQLGPFTLEDLEGKQSREIKLSEFPYKRKEPRMYRGPVPI
jgi:23S rRNA pseudouridine2605 synthase